MATECASKNRCKAEPNPSFTIDEATFEHHRTLGVRRKTEGALSVYTFRVYAPRADSVHLVGDFVGWEKGRPMQAKSHGVWEYRITTEAPLEGLKYKYKLSSRTKSCYHADPYAWQSEAREPFASIVCTESGFRFQDAAWLSHRQKQASRPLTARPFHLYEIDTATWRTHEGRPSDEAFAVLGYRELADKLTPYVKALGYTHVALSPDISAASAYHSPSTRQGGLDDFLYFVNKLHTNGVGLLYPFPWADPQPQFCEGVCSYRSPGLLAYTQLALSHLVETCHIDGFWLSGAPNEKAQAFAAFFAERLKREHPELLFLQKGELCQDLSVFDAVSDGAKEGALSRYFSCDPFFRRYHHGELSPSGQTLLCEPDSSQRTLMSTLFGSYENKFATMRLYHTFRLFYPAPLHSCMGNELAPFTPRRQNCELEWFLLDFSMHRRYFNFVKAANTLYLENRALYAGEHRVLYENENDNTLVVERRYEGESLIGVFNFSAVLLSDYTLPIPTDSYEIFSSDSLAFGGSGHENTRKSLAAEGGTILDIPPLSAVILRIHPNDSN